jgi:predicted  nucleic acid-binding Zn-ribbon protein
MKAEVAQQRSLLVLTELDAELNRLAHRATHLPEQQRCQELEAQQRAVSDRRAVVSIAAEDLDAQIAKLESEVDTVRQREDRDRGLLNSGAVGDPKQLEELQHELGTLERRQANLEDTLLEVMERREQLAGEQAGEQAALDVVQADLAVAGQQRDAVLAEVERNRTDTAARRAEVAADAGPVASSLTAANWPASRRPLMTTYCAAGSAAQSCCGSRTDDPMKGIR